MAPNPQAIVDFVRTNGPSVTNQIRQALQIQDNFVVGAMLSELSSQGLLAVTHLSYGTSKFYYDPSNPQSLEAVAKYLGEKDLRAYQLLFEHKVLRHSEQTPLNRVALAVIKDYSRPFQIKTPQGEELFWRYYLVTEEEALDLIVKKYYPEQAKKQEANKEAVEKTSEIKKPISEPISESLAESVSVPVSAPHSPKQEKPSAQEKKKKQPKTKKSAPGASEFSQKLAEYFTEREIIMEEDLGSNKTELTALVRIPSAIGDVRYFCKAKVKKLTTDGDLAAAYLEAQHRGMPLLYLAAGKLTKKAQNVLPTLKGANVIRPWAEDS